jgi:hypothetical protein
MSEVLLPAVTVLCLSTAEARSQAKNKIHVQVIEASTQHQGH